MPEALRYLEKLIEERHDYQKKDLSCLNLQPPTKKHVNTTSVEHIEQQKFVDTKSRCATNAYLRALTRLSIVERVHA